MNLTEFRGGMSRYLEMVQERNWEFPLERYNTETVAWVVPTKTVEAAISYEHLRRRYEDVLEYIAHELLAWSDDDPPGALLGYIKDAQAYIEERLRVL